MISNEKLDIFERFGHSDLQELAREVMELRHAGREVIRASNRDRDSGPTGWSEAMSKLALLVFPLPDVE